MTLRTKFALQPGVRQSDYAVRTGADIVPIESRRSTEGEADQHPSQLVTRSMNLQTQPHLISENSPTCTLTSKNFVTSEFCSSATNDCGRKSKAALPASVEPLTLPATSGS